MKDPDRLGLRNILRIIGALLIMAPLILLFPGVGAGSGKSYEPGSDTARTFSLTALTDSALGIAILVAFALGLLVLLASIFAPETD